MPLSIDQLCFILSLISLVLSASSPGYFPSNSASATGEHLTSLAVSSTNERRDGGLSQLPSNYLPVPLHYPPGQAHKPLNEPKAKVVHRGSSSPSPHHRPSKYKDYERPRYREFNHKSGPLHRNV